MLPFQLSRLGCVARVAMLDRLTQILSHYIKVLDHLFDALRRDTAQRRRHQVFAQVTKLLDKLAQCGLIERRADPVDRRAKRLFLTPAAHPMIEKLGDLGEDLMATALRGVAPESVEQMVEYLDVVRENLRQAIQHRNAGHAAEARQLEGQHHG